MFISTLVAAWSSDFIIKGPTYQTGLSVLERFSQMLPNASPVEVFDTEWKQPPMDADIVIDLHRAGAEEFQTVELGKTTTVSKIGAIVTASYFSLADPPDMNPPNPLSVVSIPSTPFGLGSCIPLFAGDLVAKTTVLQAAVVDGEIPYRNPYELDGCLIAPGTISSVHLDYHGVGQLITHFVGRKLWLVWPPTQANLELWSTKYLDQRDNVLSDYLWALEKFEGLRYVWLDVPNQHSASTRRAFYLPPYSLHVVITFSHASHGGIKIVQERWLQETKVAFEWDVACLRNHKRSGGSHESSLHEIVAAKGDVTLWQKLAQQLQGERKKRVDKFAKEAQLALVSLEEELAQALDALHAQKCQTAKGKERAHDDDLEQPKPKGKGKGKKRAKDDEADDDYAEGKLGEGGKKKLRVRKKD